MKKAISARYKHLKTIYTEQSTGCYPIHPKKSSTQRTPTNACLLPALTTCSTVMVVILL
jgi:hypothetical protein